MVLPETELEFEMVKTKKQIREEESAINAIYQREANNKMFAEEKTICAFILEGKTFEQWMELDMFPVHDAVMMNRAELSLLKKHCPKSLKRDADSVLVYAKGDVHGNFTEKETYHWYKEVK